MLDESELALLAADVLATAVKELEDWIFLRAEAKADLSNILHNFAPHYPNDAPPISEEEDEQAEEAAVLFDEIDADTDAQATNLSLALIDDFVIQYA